MKPFITIAVVFLTCLSVHAQAKGNRYIDALASAPSLVVYSEDGAADATVTNVGANNSGAVENPIPEVRSIINLGARAIPLLIAHLNDTRLTSATFNGGFTRGKPIRVPVGYVCLDILTHIIGDNPHIFVRNCGDDGLGACVNSEYYFRPDEYYPAGHDYIAREGVHVAKVNWLRAYRKGLIKFQYPAWWKRRI